MFVVFLCLFVGAAVVASIYHKREDSKVDVVITDGMREAESELYEVIEHIPTTLQRVVMAREEASRKVLSISGDELAARALDRAERFRRRLAASDDTK